MNIYDKKSKMLILLVLTVILLFLLLGVTRSKTEELGHNSNVVIRMSESSEIELGVYFPLSDTINGASDFLIRMWHNSEDGLYYLFLPAGIENKEMYWLLQPETNIRIEQKKIENGDRFELTAGRYNLEIEKKGDYSNITLEIMKSQEIPSLFVETTSATMDYIHEKKGNEESGTYTILDKSGKVQHAGRMEKFRGRGNVTWEDTEKKSYQITLEISTELLSMPQEKQWVLNPNSFDVSLLKNKICYDLARELGMPFTPELEYVDLYINGEYRGNYLLMEKVEIGEHRVAIRNLEKEMEMMNEQPLETMESFEIDVDDDISYKGSYIPNQPEDITGGYLLEMDITPRYREECSGFISNMEQKVTIKSPKYASYEQVDYIRNKYQELEDALFSEDGYNPTTGKYYSEYLDIESAINKYIVEEISMNLDKALTSQYFYKQEDRISEKFYWGPVWDFDKSLGVEAESRAGVDLNVPYENIHAGSKIRESDVLYALYQREDFRTQLVEEFASEASPIIEWEIEEVIPNTRNEIFESSKMNLVRWNYYGDTSLDEKIAYYDEEVESIRNFMRERIAFLKKEWNIE